MAGLAALALLLAARRMQLMAAAKQAASPAAPAKCARCPAPAGPHEANLNGKIEPLCCECYTLLVDRLLEMIEEIRESVR